MADSVRAEFVEAMLDQMAGGGLRQAQSERGGAQSERGGAESERGGAESERGGAQF